MSPNKRTFEAPSPKDGTLKKWEALVELGTAEPYAFVSTDSGEHEEYKPGSKEYDSLLKEYKQTYPED